MLSNLSYCVSDLRHNDCRFIARQMFVESLLYIFTLHFIIIYLIFLIILFTIEEFHIDKLTDVALVYWPLGHCMGSDWVMRIGYWPTR